MGQGYFAGIDLHKTVIQLCVLDARGEVVEEQRIVGRGPEDGAKVLAVLRSFRDGLRVVIESVGMNRWLVDQLRSEEIEVAVADPARLGLRQSGKKTDRRDAHELARRLYLGDIDRAAKSYYANDEEYGQRKVLRVRHQLVQIRQQLVNQIRGVLNAYRIVAPATSLWRPRALAWLRQESFADTGLRAGMVALVDTLEQTQVSIRALDVEIKRLAKESRTAQLLVEIVPSVGEQTALTLCSELGDVKRFHSSKAVVSQAGLAPRVANSADRQHHGRITKRGSPELRWILTQTAVRLLHKDAVARRWAAPMLRRMHANKVRIALARRLLVGLYHMLTTGEVFSLERCLTH